MKEIKNLFARIRAMGQFNVQPATLESELMYLGFEIERRRREGISIHDRGSLAGRLLKVRNWSRASGWSKDLFNGYLDDGLHNLIGRRGEESI